MKSDRALIYKILNMKKTILLAAAMLPVALFAQNQPTKLTEVYALGGGNHNRDCRGGGGRCFTDIITQSEEKTNVIVRKLSENQVELSIHKNDFSEEELNQILQDMNFVISESTRIEESVLRELKIDPKLTFISAGSYPVRLKDERFDITLPLSER